MFTQTVILWILGVGLTLALSVGTGMFSLIGILIFTLYKNFSGRITVNEKSLRNLERKLETRIVSSNDKVLDAISELKDASVHKNDCGANIRMIEQRNANTDETSRKDHERLDRKMGGILDLLEKVMVCLHDIQAKRDCKI